MAWTCCPGVSDESGAESEMLAARRPLRSAFAVRPSGESGARRLEDSQETRRSAWNPKSTGAKVRYERWGRRIEKRNLSEWRRTRESTHHSGGSDATMVRCQLGGSVDAVGQTSHARGDRVSASVGWDVSWRANYAQCGTS